MDSEHWMREALAEAEAAAAIGEVPVGAVVVFGDRVVGRGRNLRESTQDPLAHAEMLAISAAAKTLGSWRLVGCSLFVTLEPCAMCAGAIVNSRIERLVFGAWDPKAGYCGSLGDVTGDARLNHRPSVEAGVLSAQCGAVLSGFFAQLRAGRVSSIVP